MANNANKEEEEIAALVKEQMELQAMLLEQEQLQLMLKEQEELEALEAELAKLTLEEKTMQNDRNLFDEQKSWVNSNISASSNLAPSNLARVICFTN